MNIAVFCSSSNQISEQYKSSAKLLGLWMANNGHTLVYGGGTGGLMDAIAEAVHENNGKIIGVIPVSICKMKRQSQLPMTLMVVESMSERKAMMQNKSDMFVVLPGGYGTLDEMFDVIAAGIVGEHQKKIILVNEGGFYNSLITQIDDMRKTSFIPANEHFKPLIAENIQQCIDLINK